MEIELLLDAHATIGESPTWSPEEQVLYWIDVKAPALHRLDPATGATRDWKLPSDIGAFALIAGRPAALVALRTGLFELDLGSGALVLRAPPPFDPALHRFNEGACDAAGRFWVGTMFDPVDGGEHPAEPATLHRYTSTDGLVAQPDAAELHNGMAWSPDGGVFYLSHSQRRRVFAFAFDAHDGRLGERRDFATIPESLGLPDGAAMDTEGGYWCAVHGGGRLHRYRPDGTLDRAVMLPVSQPTMCAFAGPALDVMVVTSASDKLTSGQLRAQPHAGGLFRLIPGQRGTVRNCYAA